MGNTHQYRKAASLGSLPQRLHSRPMRQTEEILVRRIVAMDEDIRAQATEQRPLQAGIETDHCITGPQRQCVDVGLANGRVIGHQHHSLGTAKAIEQTFVESTEDILITPRQSGQIHIAMVHWLGTFSPKRIFTHHCVSGPGACQRRIGAWIAAARSRPTRAKL